MGLGTKFKNFMGLNDEDEFDDNFLDEQESSSDDFDNFEFNTVTDFEENEDQESDSRFLFPKKNKRYSKKDDTVVNINTTTQLQVVLVKPERFEDASEIADHLLSKRTVVLNLESTNRDISRRLVDFLSGVAYANGGQIKKIANSTYIITPYNVGLIGGNLLDELENSGFCF